MLKNNFIKINRLIALVVFLLTFVVYFDTMAPTVSYWDCGEFIAVSHTLGVPHPPGSPFFLLLGRIFSMIPFNDDVAFRVNIISPLVSALAVMLLYLSIVKVVTHWRGKVNSSIDSLIVFGGGVSGALAFAFTDSQKYMLLVHFLPQLLFGSFFYGMKKQMKKVMKDICLSLRT